MRSILKDLVERGPRPMRANQAGPNFSSPGTPRFFPLTSVDSLVRTLVPGLLSQIESIAIPSVWRVVLVAVAQRSMFRRLVR